MRIGVHNQKGGAGKTTIAMAIAAASALSGKTTLLVDADPQGTVSAWQEARGRLGLGPVDHLMIEHHPTPNLHTWLPDVMKRTGAAVAVIDGAPRADEAISRSIVAASDRILIPVQPSLADLWAARPIIQLIQEARGQGLTAKAAFVISRIKPGTILGREFAEVIRDQGLPVLKAGTVDRVAYAAALSAAQTIFEYEPSGKAAQEATALLAAVKEMK